MKAFTLLKIIRASALAGVLFLIITSCQTTLRLVETDKQEHYLNYQEEASYCSEQAPIEFSSDHPYLVDLAIREITPLYQKGQLSFREVIQLFALGHMVIAPDRYAPASRFQFFLSEERGSRPNYQDIFAKDPLRSHNAMLLGIKTISPNSLGRMISLLNRILPQRLPVDKELAEFLETHKENLLTIPSVRERYFKGELPLQEGESFPRPTLTEIRRAFAKIDHSKDYYQSDFLFDTKSLSENSPWKCNFDAGIYTHSIYLVREDQKLSFGLFGVRAGLGQWFLASSIFNPAHMSAHPDFKSVWSTSERTPPSAMCYQRGEVKSIAMVSTGDRDPGQHLYHLLELEQNKIDDFLGLKTYIDFTRYLILFSPERIVLESRRAGKDQIDKYLRFPIPLYHAEKLGRIWGLAEFYQLAKDSPARSHGFVLDGREEGYLSCGP